MHQTQSANYDVDRKKCYIMKISNLISRFCVQCDTVYFIALKDNIFYRVVIKLENACNTQLNLHKYII